MYWADELTWNDFYWVTDNFGSITLCQLGRSLCFVIVMTILDRRLKVGVDFISVHGLFFAR